MPNLASLPSDVHLEIASHADFENLIALSRVCRSLRSALAAVLFATVRFGTDYEGGGHGCSALNILVSPTTNKIRRLREALKGVGGHVRHFHFDTIICTPTEFTSTAPALLSLLPSLATLDLRTSIPRFAELSPHISTLTSLTDLRLSLDRWTDNDDASSSSSSPSAEPDTLLFVRTLAPLRSLRTLSIMPQRLETVLNPVLPLGTHPALAADFLPELQTLTIHRVSAADGVLGCPRLEDVNLVEDGGGQVGVRPVAMRGGEQEERLRVLLGRMGKEHVRRLTISTADVSETFLEVLVEALPALEYLDIYADSDRGLQRDSLQELLDAFAGPLSRLHSLRELRFNFPLPKIGCEEDEDKPFPLETVAVGMAERLGTLEVLGLYEADEWQLCMWRAMRGARGEVSMMPVIET